MMVRLGLASPQATLIVPSGFRHLVGLERLLGDGIDCPRGRGVVLDIGSILLYQAVRIAQFFSEVGRRSGGLFAGGFGLGVAAIASRMLSRSGMFCSLANSVKAQMKTALTL
jgi:hypothetical protein